MIRDRFLYPALLVLLCTAGGAQVSSSAYLGFDRNLYPGDANLQTLRRTFTYSGYWLNNPPGESSNTWRGHRVAVESAGFGFLVLFNGRLYAELRSEANAKRLGRADAIMAAASARHEGFHPGTVIFLDQEQGGRMLPEQKAYIFAWVDSIVAAGFQAGIYCSAIPDTKNGNVVTAVDIRDSAGSRQITYWAINDGCPPSPGCVLSQRPPRPADSGVGFAEVWQFVQSPRRKDVAARCTAYNPDGNCYPPGTTPAQALYVDVNTATSGDPSHGRSK